MMPDFRHPTDPDTTPTDSWAWLPPGLSTLILAGLIVSVAVFVRILYRVRLSVGLEGEKYWFIAIGFTLIELYLIRRGLGQWKRAREMWRRTHKGYPPE